MGAPGDALFFCSRDMAQAELHGFAGGTAAVFSTRRPDAAEPNEDGAALIPLGERSGLIAVADGVGGLPAGAHAAEIALQALQESLAERPAPGDSLRAAVLDGFERANARLLDAGLGAATTLVVAEIHEGAVRPYHAGDSELLVVGQRGKLKLVTVAHSPVGYLVEAGLLDEREALHHAERHVISNAVGVSDMRIEIGSSVRLAPRDTLLLATDGLFDNLHRDEVVARIRKGELAQGVARLIEDSQGRMRDPRDGDPSKSDDLTLVAFRPVPYST